jgi:hypothetical protein
LRGRRGRRQSRGEGGREGRRTRRRRGRRPRVKREEGCAAVVLSTPYSIRPVINLSTFLEFLDQISMMTYCFIVVR